MSDNSTDNEHSRAENSPATIQTPSQLSPEMPLSGWSTEDSTLIKTLREKGLDWDSIATRLQGKSAISCPDHYGLSYEQEQLSRAAIGIEGFRGDGDETVNS